ncbi:hypothetical protein LEP1GSC021_1423 [Leptospira noguchii str. 1993005606]|nr:hypothetical protein LEP1GSC021_1423 [Leptospira noguchii str. 1993005606]
MKPFQLLEIFCNLVCLISSFREEWIETFSGEMVRSILEKFNLFF